MKNLSLYEFVATALILGSTAAQADVGTRWTAVACNTVRSAQEAPAAAERRLAAALEAISAARRGEGENGNGGSPKALSEHRDAAVAVAAFAVLESLYPDERESLEADLAVSMSFIAETQAKADGARLGRRLASEIVRGLRR
jgi:hypothetical protein